MVTHDHISYKHLVLVSTTCPRSWPKDIQKQSFDNNNNIIQACFEVKRAVQILPVCGSKSIKVTLNFNEVDFGPKMGANRSIFKAVDCLS